MEFNGNTVTSTLDVDFLQNVLKIAKNNQNALLRLDAHSINAYASNPDVTTAELTALGFTKSDIEVLKNYNPSNIEYVEWFVKWRAVTSASIAEINRLLSYFKSDDTNDVIIDAAEFE